MMRVGYPRGDALFPFRRSRASRQVCRPSGRGAAAGRFGAGAVSAYEEARRMIGAVRRGRGIPARMPG